jgi:hypothetical protein
MEMMDQGREETYWLLRIGSVAAILGALLAAVGNLLHPVTPRDDPEGVAQVMADSSAWTLIHVVIIVGIILMLAGLVGIRHSISGGAAEALARLGTYAATVGVTLGLLTVILDGVGAKQLADQWAAAPEAERAVALSLVSTNETLNFSIAGLFNLSFAGVPFILLGLATALSGVYAPWDRVGRRRRRRRLGRSGPRPGIHGEAHDGLPDPDDHRSHGDLRLGLRDGDLHRQEGEGTPDRCAGVMSRRLRRRRPDRGSTAESRSQREC